MSGFYRRVAGVCWGLGVLSLVAGLVFRVLPNLQLKTTFSPRGGLILAAVLFLCSMATRELERPASSGS